MALKYCMGCEYVYSTEQQKKLSEGKSVRCLCRQEDFGTANELEPSAGRWGGGLGRNGTHGMTSDYGELARGKP